MTNSQEIFCRNIVQGKTQRQAYIIAFPRSKQWKKTTLDSRASSLMKNENVKNKIIELQKAEDKKIQWTRERATKEILYVLEMNKKEQENIIRAYEQEIEILEIKLRELKKDYKKTQKIEIKKEINQVVNEIIQLKKIPRVNAINTRAILEAVNLLNKMYGLYKVLTEITSQDEERENMKALTVEELKAIAYYNKK